MNDQPVLLPLAARMDEKKAVALVATASAARCCQGLPMEFAMEAQQNWSPSRLKAASLRALAFGPDPGTLEWQWPGKSLIRDAEGAYSDLGRARWMWSMWARILWQACYKAAGHAVLAHIGGLSPIPRRFAKLENSPQGQAFLPLAVGQVQTDFHAYTIPSEMSSGSIRSAQRVGYRGQFSSSDGAGHRHARIDTHRPDDIAEIPQIDLLKVDAARGRA